MPRTVQAPSAFIARTTFRPPGRLFGIRRGDRRHHLYCIGKTGTGKSTLLKTLVAQDLANGEGLALFDPHGDLAEAVVGLVPEERQGDLLYVNAPDVSQVWYFNPLSGVSPSRRPLAAAGMVDVAYSDESDHSFRWNPTACRSGATVAFSSVGGGHFGGLWRPPFFGSDRV